MTSLKVGTITREVLGVREESERYFKLRVNGLDPFSVSFSKTLFRIQERSERTVVLIRREFSPETKELGLYDHFIVKVTFIGPSKQLQNILHSLGEGTPLASSKISMETDSPL